MPRRSRARWLPLPLLVAVTAAAVSSAQERPPCGVGLDEFATEGDKFALLASIDRYPEASMPPLAGPRNDMDRLCAVLKDERYGHADSTILRLHGPDADRASLIAGLEALAQRADEGVVLTFAYAGHGSWVPDQPDAREEPDGRDETLCPYDRHTAGDIRDDQVHDVLQRMLAADAHVVVVFDACHSGSGTRGPADDPAGVFHYRKAPDASPAGAPWDGAGGDGGGLVGALGRHEGLTLLAAAADHQKAAESDVAVGFGITRRHGAFSHALARALEQARPGAPWDELVPVIQAGMPRGLHHQTPQFAGDLRTEVFGTAPVTEQPHFTVERVLDGGATITVAATAAAMLEEGSILAVYAPGTEQLRGGEGLLGRWQVSDQGARRVTAQRLGEAGAAVSPGAPVVLTVPGGAFRLRTVQVSDDVPQALRSRIEAGLQETPLVRLRPAGGEAAPDLRIFVHERGCLVISSGLTPWPPGVDDPDAPVECVPPSGTDEELEAAARLVTNRVGLIAGYERFLAIRNPNEGDFKASELVELGLIRFESKRGSRAVIPHRPVHPETEEAVFCPGDRFTGSLRAIGGASVYATVVYLPNDGGIWPRTFDAASQALAPSSEAIPLEGVLSVGPPCGVDYLKVFVVEATRRSKAFDAEPYKQRGFPAQTRSLGDPLGFWVEPFLDGTRPKTRGAGELETGWSTLEVPLRVVGCDSAERELLCAER